MDFPDLRETSLLLESLSNGRPGEAPPMCLDTLRRNAQWALEEEIPSAVAEYDDCHPDDDRGREEADDRLFDEIDLLVALASSPVTPPDVLSLLAEQLEHLSSTSWAWDHLSQFQGELVANPRTPPDAWKAILENGDRSLRIYIAINWELPLSILNHLVTFDDPATRVTANACILLRCNTPEDLVEPLKRIFTDAPMESIALWKEASGQPRAGWGPVSEIGGVRQSELARTISRLMNRQAMAQLMGGENYQPDLRQALTLAMPCWNDALKEAESRP